jgi:hypothetical protein
VRPLAQCPAHRLAAVRGVFTDVDDTLTRNGVIEPAALQALRDLDSAGIPVIAITGRPIGWSLPFARGWPVRAIVAENGAVAVQPDARTPDGLRLHHLQSEGERAVNRVRLDAVARDILAHVPHAQLARDSAGRLTDIAIDHSEFTSLSAGDVTRVVNCMRGAGMVATVSSIHINGWFGNHDKWRGACWMAGLLLGADVPGQRHHWLCVGDSTNDQALFEQLPLSVGVANLTRFAHQLVHWPAFITQAERGEGFAEMARALLLAKRLA